MPRLHGEYIVNLGASRYGGMGNVTLGSSQVVRMGGTWQVPQFGFEDFTPFHQKKSVSMLA